MQFGGDNRINTFYFPFRSAPGCHVSPLHDHSSSVEQKKLRHPNAREALPRDVGPNSAVAQLLHTNPSAAQRKFCLVHRESSRSCTGVVGDISGTDFGFLGARMLVHRRRPSGSNLRPVPRPQSAVSAPGPIPPVIFVNISYF
ncbi:hypothetical protein JTB14_016997 [Gonioctena quinquepunctata]|nr:hypothetical protein JTB14_016997 [Gonioctena quinquepunctata]